MAINDRGARSADPSGAGSMRLPQVFERGGSSGWVAALIAGAILGGVTLIVPSLLDAADAFAFLAVLLGFIGGVYFGFAVTDGRQREVLD